VSDDRPDQRREIDLYARRRAYESVAGVIAAGCDTGRGLVAAQHTASDVLAERGVDGLADVTVELSLKLASAMERIAMDRGLAAVDLIDGWFAD
jgi:hypothetical protein